MKARHIAALWPNLGGQHYHFDDDCANVYVHCPLARWTHKKGVDTSPSFSIKVSSVEKSVCMCWSAGCNFKGTLEQLLFKIKDHDDSFDIHNALTFVSAHDTPTIDDILSILPSSYDCMNTVQRERTYPDTCLRDFIPLTKSWRDLSLETLNKWEIMYDPDKERIVFPVRNHEKEVIGVIGRTVNDSKPKYLNYWKFRKSNYIYGESHVKHRRCIIAEGPFDALKIYDAISNSQIQNYDVVSLMGSIPSKKQIEKIKEYFDECIIYLDNDDAGRNGTSSLCGKLLKSMSIKIVCYTTLKKDPGAQDNLGIVLHILNSIEVIPT